MEPPRVTVLLSVHNGLPYLKECLESLLSQTEARFLCLAMDDGSTDGSGRLLSETACRDGRFQVFRHNERAGLTASLNELLARAGTPLVARADADDISRPDRLLRQANFLDRCPTVGAVGSAFHIIDEGGEALGTVRPPGGRRALASRLRKRNVLAHGSLMLRREAIVSAQGYRPEFVLAQDYDLLLRLSERWEIAALEDPLYCLRLTRQGLGVSRQDRQAYFSELARRCHRLRRQGESDVDFCRREAGEAPAGGGGAWIPELRYRYLRSLHLLKSGRLEAARQALCFDVSTPLPQRVIYLKRLALLPAPILSALLWIKSLWDRRPW